MAVVWISEWRLVVFLYLEYLSTDIDQNWTKEELVNYSIDNYITNNRNETCTEMGKGI